MCGPHQVWPLRSECCGRGVPTKVVCAECMKMCCLGGKNSVVKGLIAMHDSLILGPRLRGNHHVNKANLQWFLLMNADLLQGTEQALMLHSVSIIIPCIFDVAVVVNVYCCLNSRMKG